MPRLDERLKSVARQIRCTTHVDVGSDHGHLLKALLAAKRIQFGIAIENKPQPLANSRATLAGLAADVRLGNGLEPLHDGEADSVSICGMGGEQIAQILSAFPSRVPPRVIVQPNKRADLLRSWALSSEFNLVDELIVGERPHEVLIFEQRESANDDDPAYRGLDRNAAVQLGPWHIRRGGETFVARLLAERAYLERLPQRNELSQRRVEAINTCLA